MGRRTVLGRHSGRGPRVSTWNAGSIKMRTNAASARVCTNASKLSRLSSAPYKTSRDGLKTDQLQAIIAPEHCLEG